LLRHIKNNLWFWFVFKDGSLLRKTGSRCDVTVMSRAVCKQRINTFYIRSVENNSLLWRHTTDRQRSFFSQWKWQNLRLWRLIKIKLLGVSENGLHLSNQYKELYNVMQKSHHRKIRCIRPLRLHVLHYQSFCDRSRNFAKVHSTFWRFVRTFWGNWLKHFLQILQNLEFTFAKFLLWLQKLW
jgi:hypothetical protein